MGGGQQSTHFLAHPYCIDPHETSKKKLGGAKTKFLFFSNLQAQSERDVYNGNPKFCFFKLMDN